MEQAQRAEIEKELSEIKLELEDITAMVEELRKLRATWYGRFWTWLFNY